MRVLASLYMPPRLRQWLRFRAALRQLRLLSADELEDLGLKRGELRAMAHKSGLRRQDFAPAPDIIGGGGEAAA